MNVMNSVDRSKPPAVEHDFGLLFIEGQCSHVVFESFLELTDGAAHLTSEVRQPEDDKVRILVSKKGRQG